MSLKIVFLSLLFFSMSNAQVIPLESIDTPATTLPGFDESMNHSPSFYIWQNDPALSSYYTTIFSDGTGVTGLCLPSSLSNVLLYQFLKRTPRLTNLKLPGISDDLKKIDGSLLVKGLLAKCDLENTNKINTFTSAECLMKFYHEAGYQDAEVKIVRNEKHFSKSEDVIHENRSPTISDIHQALKDGYEVIAAIAFMKWNPVKKVWIKASSHAITIYGYSANASDSDQKITVYISNSNRMYNVNNQDPVFDIATLEINSTLEVMPEPYTNIEIKTVKGRLLNFDGKSTFLAGLILSKPN